MEQFIFGRFHACEHKEDAVARVLRTLIEPTRAEPGCVAIQAYRSLGDLRLFYLHARWIDEAALTTHSGRPHTRRFVEEIAPLIDHPLEIAPATPIG